MTLTGGKKETFAAKHVPVPACPLQMSHELGWGLNPELRDTWPEIDPLSDDSPTIHHYLYDKERSYFVKSCYLHSRGPGNGHLNSSTLFR